MRDWFARQASEGATLDAVGRTEDLAINDHLAVFWEPTPLEVEEEAFVNERLSSNAELRKLTGRRACIFACFYNSTWTEYVRQRDARF